MPKIESIRIAGLQYNKMQKRYEDMLFDFSSSDEAQHALVTLVNGGGKGAFLQTVFQVVLPGTNWGPSGERKYQHYFYNNKKQFVPYTFHVAIEWRKDSGEGFITTGAVMTAEKKAYKKEGQEESTEYKIVPKYTLYTSEYKKPSDFSLSNLPFVDEDNKIITHNVFLGYLKENKSDIQTYSKNEQYYRYIETYNITQDEWRTMKGINKEEGGVKDYFKNSLDNKSLFHTKIIPTISQQLNLLPEYKSENSLEKIFKHQASIARNLPILKNQERAYKELLALLVPVENKVEKGIKQLEQEQIIIEEGHQILKNIDELIKEEERTLAQTISERNLTSTRAKEVAYLLDNVDYVRYTDELERLNIKAAQVEEKLEKLTLRKEELEAAVKQNKTDILLKKWKEAADALSITQNSINDLKKSQASQDIEEQIEKVKASFKQEAQNVKIKITHSIGTYKGISKKLEGVIAHNKKELNVKTTQIGTLSGELRVSENEIKKYNEMLPQLEEKYGEKMAKTPESFKKNTIHLLNNLTASLAQIEKEVVDLDTKKSNILNERGGVSSELTMKDKEISQRQQTYTKRLKAEGELGEKISSVLLDDTEIYNRSWFELAEARMNELMLNKEEEIQKARREVWKKQIDASLNKEDFLNDDIKLVQEVIEKQGISTTLGVNFILSLSVEQREVELQKNPLLRYGIVLLKSDWSKVKKEKLNDLRLRSLVPVFIREESNVIYPFYYANDKTFLITSNEDEWQTWKDNAVTEMKELEQVIDKSEKTIKQYRHLQTKIHTLLEGEFSTDVHFEIERLQNEKVGLEQILYTLNSDLQKKDTELKSLRTKVSEHKESINKTEQTLHKTENWIVQTNEYKAYLQKEKDLSVRLKELTEERNAVNDNLEKSQKRLQSISAEYQLWYGMRNNEVENFTKVDNTYVLPSFDNVQPIESSSFEVSDTYTQQLSETYKLWEVLKRKELNANSELAVLEERKTNELRVEKDFVKSLNRLQSGWKELNIPVESHAQLEEAKITLKKELEEKKELLSDSKGQKTKVETQIEENEKNLLNTSNSIREKHLKEATYIEIEDIEQCRQEYKEQLKAFEKDIKDLDKLSSLTQKQIDKLKNVETQVSSHVEGQSNSASIDSGLYKQLKQDSSAVGNTWIAKKKRFVGSKEMVHKEVEREFNRLKQTIEFSNWETTVKEKIGIHFSSLDTRKYELVSKSIETVKAVANKCIEGLQGDLEKAEYARQQWTERATMKVFSVVEQLKKMQKKMTFKNKAGFNFPLIKLDESKSKLPNLENQEEVERLLNGYFVDCIAKLNQNFSTFDMNDVALDKEIESLMKDEEIVFVSLRRRYPKLHIYNLQTTNAFQYDAPKSTYYSAWETINKGDEAETSGSGGQTLSARMMLMMMLISFRKQSRGLKQWTTIISDNPFGQAVSPHVLDPIFAVTSIFNFQWIVVSPPELIKTGVSQRFSSYYQLELEAEKGIEKITAKYRIYEEQ